ncbi:hypothetical protein [Sphingomonas sp.]|uniref:hypothetical protein n=1 Tax=Sphingomonas sp. TaxID=28214 RepID=UPI003918146E
MPIAPEHRWLYPIDWAELSRLIRFRRAKGRCEHCQRPHGREVIHLGEGTWWDEDAKAWRDGRGKRARPLKLQANLSHTQLLFAGMDPPSPLMTRVVLASAHLNHDPGDNRPSNLAALCQRCHMIHDAPEHRRRRWLNRFRQNAIRDLFA